MNKKNLPNRINISGWTNRHDEYIEMVHSRLACKGIHLTLGDKPNTSAILRYILEKEAKQLKEEQG